MYELITDKTLAEYEAFVQSHPKGNFAQSSLWAKQKPMWTWDAVAVRGEDGKIKGSLALMTRKVPGIGRTLMYGCRGPVCDLDDRETFAQLLEGAKALAKKYKSYVIKLDPDVPSSNTAFAALMQSFGFRCKEGGKNFEAKDVFDAARNGDALAAREVDEMTDTLGMALANIAATTDPEMFMIGGGVARAGEVLFDPLREHYKTYAFKSCRETPIVAATLGNDAGIYGAVRLIVGA